MSLIGTAITRFDNFFFSRDERDVGFLSFLRVSVSLICLVHFCAIWQDFLKLYGNDGFVPAELIGLFKTGWVPSFGQLADWLNKSIGISEEITAIAFKTLYIYACLTLCRGWIPPLSALVVLSLHLILTKGSPLYAYGIDYFKTIALFYCVVFFVGNWLIHNHTPFRRVLQLHLAIVYFFSGAEKSLGYNWHNGEAIWKAIHLPYLATGVAQQADVLSYFPFVFTLAGWVVILLELGYPLFINLPKTRKTWLLAIILMHVCIAISLRLYFYSATMIMLNIVAFTNLNTYYRSLRSIY